jgi:hypothetical protein
VIPLLNKNKKHGTRKKMYSISTMHNPHAIYTPESKYIVEI